MATALNIKRKNIDLPVDTLQKLSIMAVAQGKSLKNFIETILISKANAVAVEVSENPSPSGDPWFNDPENIASLNRGIAEMKAGKGRAYSMEEIRELLLRIGSNARSRKALERVAKIRAEENAKEDS